jgi:alanyl-tRNA synthetase
VLLTALPKMKSQEIRQKFIDYFKERGHAVVPSSSLVPEDPSVLLTTAGMQPFKKYFLGEVADFGSRATSCQKCFRTSDIEQVGDSAHLTFLEMLGNFSFGDYFKQETAAWALDLLTNEYRLPLSRLRFTYFGGDEKTEADLEIKEIWEKLNIPKDVILAYGREDNFWGPTGLSGPCGPTSEIHYDLTGQPCAEGDKCQPGCGCGRFVEIWNLVFNQYYQDEEGNLTLLQQSGIDTGMGLERLALAIQGSQNVFQTDLFAGLVDLIKEKTEQKNPHFYRIVADHCRGLVFLVSEGIEPSNLGRGYIVRRIVRRLLEAADQTKLSIDCLGELLSWVEENYRAIYPEIQGSAEKGRKVLELEVARLDRARQKGLSELSGSGKEISGEEAFRLYSTYGLSPVELEKQGYFFNQQELETAIENHKNVSRKGAEKKFGGHGIGGDESQEQIEIKTRLHTATHLLQAALHEVLGSEVAQRGSDINLERLRFDFSFDRALTDAELSEVSGIINQKIQEGLNVVQETMSLDKARGVGATMMGGQKYPEQVDVYAIINSDNTIFSREVCGGPHVLNTKEIGLLEIIKEQSSSAGVRRIKAILKDA